MRVTIFTLSNNIKVDGKVTRMVEMIEQFRFYFDFQVTLEYYNLIKHSDISWGKLP